MLTVEVACQGSNKQQIGKCVSLNSELRSNPLAFKFTHNNIIHDCLLSKVDPEIRKGLHVLLTVNEMPVSLRFELLESLHD